MKNMTTNKKLLSLTALTAVLGASFVGVQNADAQVTVDANAEFLETIVLSSQADVDFGIIEVTGTTIGAGDTATMQTDGTITYAGVFSGAGAGTAGKVQIDAGTDGEVVDIFCDAGVKLNNSADTASVGMNTISFDMETGTSSVGGIACGGIGTGVGGITLNADGSGGGTNDEIIFGGIIDGGDATLTTGTFAQEPYSTTNGTVDPIDVDVQYQ